MGRRRGKLFRATYQGIHEPAEALAGTKTDKPTGLSMAAAAALKTHDAVRQWIEPLAPEQRPPSIFVSLDLSLNPWERVAWWQRRRKTLVRLFKEHVYGVEPPSTGITHSELTPQRDIDWSTVPDDVQSPNGPQPRAIQQFVELTEAGTTSPRWKIRASVLRPKVLITLPHGPANVTVLYLYRGNQLPDHGLIPHIAHILARGYRVVVWANGDLVDDAGERQGPCAIARQPWGVDVTAGALGLWAWGCNLVGRWLKTGHKPGQHDIILAGHSRRGKAVLWAAAMAPDPDMYYLVAPTGSGCGGSALSRHIDQQGAEYAETVKDVVTRFPAWFGPRFASYAGQEHQLPVDQHMVLALAQPTRVLCSDGADDLWAYPAGSWLATRLAGAIYEYLDYKPFEGFIGYHCRPGGHDVLLEDWNATLDFYELSKRHDVALAKRGRLERPEEFLRFAQRPPPPSEQAIARLRNPAATDKP